MCLLAAPAILNGGSVKVITAAILATPDTLSSLMASLRSRRFLDAARIGEDLT